MFAIETVYNTCSMADMATMNNIITKTTKTTTTIIHITFQSLMKSKLTNLIKSIKERMSTTNVTIATENMCNKKKQQQKKYQHQQYQQKQQQHKCISSVVTSVLTSAAVYLLLFFYILSSHTNCVAALAQSSSYSSSSSSLSSNLGVHVIRSPESAVAPKGDEVIFECELNLTPEQLKWRFRHANKRTIDGSNFDFLHTVNGYNVTTEDRISKLHVIVEAESLGDYQCVAWFGSAAIASTTASLTLVSITINNSNGYSRNAVRWSVAPKNCVLIRCGTVTSFPSPIWSFYHNDERIPQTEVMVTSNGALVLNMVSSKDSGNYSCAAMNPITAEEVKLPQRIDLRVDYSDRTPPYFLIQPSTQVTARPGDTVALECPGIGSPPPIAVWSSPNVMNINNNRTRMLPYGLQITDVRSEDQGSYVCRLDNGIAPALVHIIKLTVYEAPTILRGPARTSANESDTIELECSVKGNPYPDIYWLINGVDTSRDMDLLHDGRRLVIQRVQKRHAGIVQCFAKNVVGEISEANRLTVNPKQIHGNGSIITSAINTSQRSNNHEHNGGKNKGKKKHRTGTMIPPSRPNVTRLSDDSVMLRWYVPKNDGLPIQFFKVQYRMLGGGSHKIPRENWQTTNDDIPFGKRNRNTEFLKNFTSSVTGLKPDRYYKFRIIAVYSNNDNREGNTSAKFFLHHGDALDLAKSNLPVPILERVETLSPSAVMLHWSLPNTAATMEPINVYGFYAYYRPTTSAEEYLKATVDGANTRKFKVDTLDAGTSYEFKLQSFNELAASEFSAIVKGMTKKVMNTTPMLNDILITTKTSKDDNSMYPVVAGAIGGGILLLIATVAACLCLKKRKHSSVEEENKPQLDHIQADFVTTSQVLSITGNHHHSQRNHHHQQHQHNHHHQQQQQQQQQQLQHKHQQQQQQQQHHHPQQQQQNGVGHHRLNGVLPRMNITPNPLAQDVDKAQYLQYQGQGHIQNNVGTMHHAQPYYQSKIAASPILMQKRLMDYQQPPKVPPHQTINNNNLQHNLLHNNNNNNHHYLNNNNNNPHHLPPHPPPLSSSSSSSLSPTSQASLTPMLEHQRRTIDRNQRNLLNNNNYTMNEQNSNGLDGIPTRIPSLRRTRRISGSSNTNGSIVTSNTTNNFNNGTLGIPINGSPRVQRSPMPVRAALIKQRTRLGSHNNNDNISSGSLNSIEV